MMEGSLLPISNKDLHLAAHLFVPERLTYARDWKGMTKAELAEAIGKTPSALSQFESGKIKPDAQTIGRLGMALGVPIRFFSRKLGAPVLASDACHYRRLRAASQRDRKQLQARASLLLELVHILSDGVEWQAEKVSCLASSPKSEFEIEELAVRVRKEWGLGLGPISNVVRLLENNGVVITNIPGENQEVDAFSAWYEHMPFIFLVSEKDCASRVRFDAAHELGHLLMHVDVSPGHQDVERQADRFASAFLLPRESFLAECPRTFRFDHFLELKRRWKVSVAALVRRAYDLKYLSEASYRRAYVFLNQHGYRRNEPCEPEMEKPQLLGRVIKYVESDHPLPKLADKLAISVGDLRNLLKYSAPG